MDNNEITKKISISVQNSENICKIYIVKCNDEYCNDYKMPIHAFILKNETEHSWIGFHVLFPYFGEIEWNKNIWKCIFSFEISTEMLNNIK